MSETVTVNVTRWVCNRGHFVAEASVTSEDRIDPGAYYGVSSTIHAVCKVCGPIEEPQIVVIGTREVEVEPPWQMSERPFERVLDEDERCGY